MLYAKKKREKIEDIMANGIAFRKIREFTIYTHTRLFFYKNTLAYKNGRLEISESLEHLKGGTVHLGGGMLAKNRRGRREATSNPSGMWEVDILSGCGRL